VLVSVSFDWFASYWFHLSSQVASIEPIPGQFVEVHPNRTGLATVELRKSHKRTADGTLSTMPDMTRRPPTKPCRKPSQPAWRRILLCPEVAPSLVSLVLQSVKLVGRLRGWW